MNLVLQAIGFGIVVAAIVGLGAVGGTLQFGVTNYANFALGDYLTLGAYAAWSVEVTLLWPLWAAAVVAVLGVGLVAVLISTCVLSHFVNRDSPVVFFLIVTLGISLIIQNGIQAAWGPNSQTFPMPTVASRVVHFGPMIFTNGQLFVIGLAVLVMLAVHALLTRTRAGKALRALSDNVELAVTSGINHARMTNFVWFLSGGLAGLAGVGLAATTSSVNPLLGENLLFVIYAAVIVGGVGHAHGAMIGAVIVGLVTGLSGLVVSSAYSYDVGFVVMIVAILVRPQGLIASRGRH